MKAVVFAALLKSLSAFWQQHFQGRNPAEHLDGLLGGGTLSQKQLAVSWICLQTLSLPPLLSRPITHSKTSWWSLFIEIKTRAVLERTGSEWLYKWNVFYSVESSKYFVTSCILAATNTNILRDTMLQLWKVITEKIILSSTLMIVGESAEKCHSWGGWVFFDKCRSEQRALHVWG